MEWLKIQKLEYLENGTYFFYEIKKILNLCFRWHILRSYRSVAEVTFKHYYLNPLLDKLATEQKTAFLLGDFNVDLLKYEQHKATNEFLDSLSSSMFLPHIVQPTRITSHSKALIDNVFSNYISQDIVSGNLTATISDHSPQFLIALHIFLNVPDRKNKIF